jgi:hypothetical protein
LQTETELALGNFSKLFTDGTELLSKQSPMENLCVPSMQEMVASSPTESTQIFGKPFLWNISDPNKLLSFIIFLQIAYNMYKEALLPY